MSSCVTTQGSNLATSHVEGYIDRTQIHLFFVVSHVTHYTDKTQTPGEFMCGTLQMGLTDIFHDITAEMVHVICTLFL